MNRQVDSLLGRPMPHGRRATGQWLRRGLIFATAVLFVNALFGESGFFASLRARQEYADAREALAVIQRENASLADTARRLETDPRTIESVLRNELGYVRRGELMFVVAPER